ncbi:hypothetical protein ARMGADRAFT_1090284 [Armillaria gallica]|uniref:Uncharacterized protein n=1 Tax=Armillaria gallica TaxID=47427 RepID=A0A2H3CHA6_ARMGA|nr:hypothetical protein ARMGADRAFT_1090284 [Armillaria gallica]
MEILTLAGRSGFRTTFTSNRRSVLSSAYFSFLEDVVRSESADLNVTVQGEFGAATLVLPFEIQPVDDCDAMIGMDLAAAYNDLFRPVTGSAQSFLRETPEVPVLRRSARVVSSACQTFRSDVERCDMSDTRPFLAQGRRVISSVAVRSSSVSNDNVDSAARDQTRWLDDYLLSTSWRGPAHPRGSGSTVRHPERFAVNSPFYKNRVHTEELLTNRRRSAPQGLDLEIFELESWEI